MNIHQMNNREKWYAARLIVHLKPSNDVLGPPELTTWEEEVVNKTIGMDGAYESPKMHWFTDGTPFIYESDLKEYEGRVHAVRSPWGGSITFTGFVRREEQAEEFVYKLLEFARDHIQKEADEFIRREGYLRQNSLELEERMNVHKQGEKPDHA